MAYVGCKTRTLTEMCGIEKGNYAYTFPSFGPGGCSLRVQDVLDRIGHPQPLMHESISSTLRVRVIGF